MHKRKLSSSDDSAKISKTIPSCPYLSTIDRKSLDFDSLKVCSVTLASHNIYCCLVCGKFFQGRGASTPAMKHSLVMDHHLFVNLSSGTVYCLPEDDLVEDDTLDDVIANLKPNIKDIHSIESNMDPCVSLSGQKFYPGFVGSNDLKSTDYLNATIQCLSKIRPFRDYLLTFQPDPSMPSISSLSDLVKRIWNPKAFRNHVAPHEFLSTMEKLSNKKHSSGIQSDPYQFLVWILNSLHEESCKSKSLLKQSFVGDIFSGIIQCVSQLIPIKDDRKLFGPPSKKDSPFLILSLDLPHMPLYKDKMQKNAIPVVQLYEILKRYDGVTETLVPEKNEMLEKKIYKITKLPTCLILHFKRFTTNTWGKEKNTTIVNIPLKSLDLNEYCNVNFENSKYDLTAAICHQGNTENGIYKAYVFDAPRDKYYEIHDLSVKEVMPEEISIAETYILFYTRRL